MIYVLKLQEIIKTNQMYVRSARAAQLYESVEIQSKTSKSQKQKLDKGFR